MNCPRCNFPINKDNVWSNCPKCNCRLNLDTAPTQRVKASQQNSNTSSANNQSKSATYKNVSSQSHPKVSYCMRCGQKIEDGQEFCWKCEKEINSINQTYVMNSQSKEPTKRRVLNNSYLSRKTLLSIAGGCIALVVIVIITIIIINNKPQKDNSFPNTISGETTFNNETKTNKNVEPTTELSFDISEYDSHGNLSCDLIWVSKRNWNDEMDQYQQEFAYLDKYGNQKSNWFIYDDYEPANFKNGFVILTEKNGSGIHHKFRVNNLIYDTSFNQIGNIKSEDPNETYDTIITDFDENGFAFAEGEIKVNEKTVYGPFWIDKNGVHQFDDDIPYIRDMSTIEVTDKYFILDNLCICNHQGQIVLNMYKILREHKELNEKYTVDNMNENKIGERHQTLITNLEIYDNNYVSFEFNAQNMKSKNIVWFTCKISFSGEIIEGPTKKN